MGRFRRAPDRTVRRGSLARQLQALARFSSRPGDACVDVPGYSVRILPMSSTCHTMAYFAILSEMAERMRWKQPLGRPFSGMPNG